MSESNPAPSTEMSSLTIQDFYKNLSQKVSAYNARLLLQTAVWQSGVSGDEAAPLKKDEARNICLQLINKGGPAFQVGKDMYQKLQ